MNRTIKGLAMVALLPLAVACSHRPAQSPAGGTSTSPTETGTTPAQPPGTGTTTPSTPSAQPPSKTGPTSQLGSQEMPGTIGERGEERGTIGQRGQEGTMGSQRGQEGLGSGLGQQQGQVGEAGQGQPAATMNEREICDSLATGARLRVEDVQGGVAIVAQPKGETNLATVRDDARRLENVIRMGAASEGAAGAQGRAAHETCGLAELGRLPSVTTQVTEGTNSVRIVLTTSNNAEVRDLRRIARDELNALTKAHGGQNLQKGQRGKGGLGVGIGGGHKGGTQKTPGQQGVQKHEGVQKDRDQQPTPAPEQKNDQNQGNPQP